MEHDVIAGDGDESNATGPPGFSAPAAASHNQLSHQRTQVLRPSITCHASGSHSATAHEPTVVSSNPHCDVVLDIQGVSSVHFSLSFDESNRPIVKDLDSLIGTEVTYDGKGEGARRDFQWIIGGGHNIFKRIKSIRITIPDTISFPIVISPRDITSPDYVDMVNRFKQGTATTEELLNDLGVLHPQTRPATGAHTPGTGKIYLETKLGEGAFSVVTHLWDVSTGEERALKTPSANAIRKRLVNNNAWLKEARIMDQIEHPHIVRLFESSFTPSPRLYLEYMPYGSLEDHDNFKYNETLTIIGQCLSALSYLHGREPPIAHRDIKPANILVHSRFDGKITVKLGDFGLSRDSPELISICGTDRYFAPEIYLALQHVGARLSYTPLVDIWSLGVVACELTCGLPQFREEYMNSGLTWCDKIVTRLRNNFQQRPSDLGRFLLDFMVVLDPQSRLTADDCYHQLVGLPAADTDSFSAPILVSSPEGEDQTTVGRTLQNHGAEDPTTVIYRPRSTGVATSSHFDGSRLRPSQAFPSSSVIQETNEIPEEPSSSAVGQVANPRQGYEMAQFMRGYSTDPLNSLYVGSSLAFQLRESDDSEDSPRQFLQGPAPHNQAHNQAQHDQAQHDQARHDQAPQAPHSHAGAAGSQTAGGMSSGPSGIPTTEVESTQAVLMLLRAIDQGPREP